MKGNELHLEEVKQAIAVEDQQRQTREDYPKSMAESVFLQNEWQIPRWFLQSQRQYGSRSHDGSMAAIPDKQAVLQLWRMGPYG